MTPEELSATHLLSFGEEKAWTAETFAKLLSDPAVILAGIPESFVLGRVVADEAEVLTLATAPQYQRKGLASKALSTFNERASAAGAKSVFLEVADDNDAAKNLYTGAGFDCVGERKNYYRRRDKPAVTALILKCPLPQGK